MAAGAVVARILTQYSDKGSKQAQKDIQKLGRQIDAFGKKATKAFGLAAAATVALSVKIGKDAVKAAIEDSKSQLTLSNALRATTGATSAAVTAVEEYISRQQMLTNVQDTQLRSSLQSLVVATGDVTEAQRLQGIALDIAAATGKDLNAVTVAMVRAQQGNTTALKRLSPEMSGLITKTTKAEDIFSLLGATYEGSAKKLAKQDPLTNMQLAFGEISEQIGVALMPAVTVLTDYMITDLIPTFEEFVRLNDAKITKNILGLADAIETLVKKGAGIAGFLIQYRTLITYATTTLVSLIALSRTLVLTTAALGILQKVGIVKINIDLTRGSLNAMKQMGLLSKSYDFIIQNARKVAVAIGLITTAFRAQGIAAGIAAIATAFATAGVSVGLAATALLTVGVTAFATKRAFDSLNATQNKNAEAAEAAAKKQEELANRQYGGAAATKYQAEVEAAAAKKRAAAAKAAAAAARAADARAKKAAADAALLARVQAGLSKLGVKATNETNPIQLEAARLNLVKQGNLVEAARLSLMAKNLETQLEANKAITRYIDLIAVLSDSKISSEEVLLLSKKWGMTIEGTQAYIQTLLAVSDQKISPDEIVNLAKSWGSSTKQAERYLDFFTYLNDGKLSDAEINKLQTKWGLTSKEVGIYADLITKASDYVISDAEIVGLGTSWGLTTKEVLEYVKKLGQPVTFSGTLVDPATQAMLGWKSATEALLAYQAALAGKGISGEGAGAGAGASADAMKKAAEAKAAADAAAAKASAAAQSAATAAALRKLTGNQTLTNEERGLLGLSPVPTTQAPPAATTTAPTATSASALRKLTGGQTLTDEERGLLGMGPVKAVTSPTINTASSMGSSSSATGTTNVYLTVQGSVTSENDLVQSVRQGLLRGQVNGQSLTLAAI